MRREIAPLGYEGRIFLYNSRLVTIRVSGRWTRARLICWTRVARSLGSICRSFEFLGFFAMKKKTHGHLVTFGIPNVRIRAFAAGGQKPTPTPTARVVERGGVRALVATLVRGRLLRVAQDRTRAASPYIYDILDNETIQVDEVVPTQAPPRFIAMLVLQDTLVCMLGFLEGMAGVGKYSTSHTRWLVDQDGRMSTHLELLQCPLCPKIVHGYQKFMNHSLSHPVDLQEETYAVEGSNTQSVPLPKPLKSVQHIRTMRNKEQNHNHHPHHRHFTYYGLEVTTNDSGKNVQVNQQLPPVSPPPPASQPPPSPHLTRSVQRKEDGRGEHTNKKLVAPPPPSYHINSVRGINDGRRVHTNQQIPPPPSYRPTSLRRNDNGKGWATYAYFRMLEESQGTALAANGENVDANNTCNAEVQIESRQNDRNNNDTFTGISLSGDSGPTVEDVESGRR
uniref:Uncharacterized protein n=1 Tax=Solanum tuberosum TaxID=4113 RepID=M1BF32_SOLTU